MDSGKILYASHKGIHVLRFIGEIRHTLAPSLNDFLQWLFAKPVAASFIIDLQETDIIDSTILGLLARIAKRMDQSGRPKATIVCDRADINEILIGVGFDTVFDMVESSQPIPQEGQTLSVLEADRETMRYTILEAHRTLMELNERNRNVFHDVVEALEQERKDLMRG